MQRINDLIVRGKHAEVAKLVARFDRNPVVADWKRDLAGEQQLKSTNDDSSPTAFCFETISGPLRPVTLILRRRGWDELHVISIITKDKKPLSDVEYNQILGDFYANVLIPMSVGIKVATEMRPPRIEMEEFLSPEAMDRLREFSIASTKGDNHVPDMARWDRFVIQTHLDRDYLSDEDLDYWLMSDGFSPEDRLELLTSFMARRNLLENYDAARVH